MSRRIDKPDGTFGGIVVISVDPAYFTHFYQKADIGAEGLVALVGLDGIARARRVGHKLSFGDDLSTSGLLQEQATRPTGSFRNAGRLDGVTRYVSYRTLADYPLVVAVATAEDEVLSRYTSNRLRAYRTALLVSIVIAIFAALLLWAVTRQKRAAAALAEDIAERKRLEAESASSPRPTCSRGSRTGATFSRGWKRSTRACGGSTHCRTPSSCSTSISSSA